MGAAPAMDRRLAVRKSSSKISKSSSSSSSRSGLPSSSPPRRPSSSSTPSRPPATVVNADLSNFRRVVQQLTGTPPQSASPSPVRDSPKPSRLQLIAPPPLRHRLQHSHRHSHVAARNHQQHQYEYMQRQDRPIRRENYTTLSQHNLSDNWLLPPPPPPPLSTHENSNLPLLSPHLLSPLPVLTPGDNAWVNSLVAITSPRVVSNSANVLPPPPPFLPELTPVSSDGRELAMEWSMMPAGGHLYSHNPSSYEHATDPHAASSLNSLFSSSHGFSPTSNRNTLRSPFPSRHFLHSPTSNAQPLLLTSTHSGMDIPPSNGHLLSPLAPYPNPLLPPLPSPAALPLSPYSASLSPTSSFSWLPPWPPSPAFPSPPLLSPGLFPPSPGPFPPMQGLGFPPSPSLARSASSPTGFSFQPTNNHPRKPP